MREFRFLAATIFLFCYSAQAEDALHCVTVGQGDRSQTLINTCDFAVEVLWCHSRSDTGYKRSMCGSNGRYFQKQAVLSPGQVKENQFSLPFNSTIFFAACDGSYYSIREMDSGGGYLCE